MSNLKEQILMLYDYALSLAEEYKSIEQSHMKKDFLTAEGKAYEIKKLQEWKWKDIAEVLKTIQGIIDKGIAELQAKWEKQSAEVFNDELLMNAIGQIKDIRPTEEVLSALVNRYRDNPIALGMIKSALKDSDLIAIVPEDYRNYNLDLLQRTKSALQNYTAEDLKRDEFAQIDLYGRKDFIENRIKDDLSLY